MKPQFIYIHESHLDLFWIGDYRFCLQRGRHVIKEYIDRCLEYPDESFLLETVVFLEDFLREHPDYEAPVRKLWREGRLDIGAAYVDVLEHLVLGESQIRNIVRGRRWCRERLSIDTTLAAHADLPSLIPQMPQVYRKAGVSCYSTSRKLFPDGHMWVHVAPDGTAVKVFNHPLHYDFHELRRNARALNEGRGWNKYLDPADALKGFPLGKVVLSAGAADQADLECFRKRYGKSAREFVEEYRTAFPEFEFRFGTVSEMAQEYEGHEGALPHLSGEIPSVWGMSSVPSTFFQMARQLEGRLLTAEFLASVGRWYGLPPIAEARDEWHGTLYEKLYFLGKDPIPRGAEMDELWKMHLFVCDHNFSGNFASQTAFDKRTIQERALGYAQQMVSHGLGCLAGPGQDERTIALFNPLNWPRTEPVELSLPAHLMSEGLTLTDAEGRAVPWQPLESPDAAATTVRIAAVPTAPAAAYTFLTLGKQWGRGADAWPDVSVAGGRVSIGTPGLRVEADGRTGAIVSLQDRHTGADWGSPRVGKLYAMHEDAFDVPLSVDESKVLAEEIVRGAEVTSVGPAFAQVTLTKAILNAHVTQQVTVWQPPVNAVDIRTTVLWHGQHRVQVRQCLPTAPRREDVFYGTPFYGCNWLNLVPGSWPRNPDEMACLEHWRDYRELQLWIHQRQADSALAIASLHATYHWGRDGLEAVLMRTTPSCADDRYFWEHAGRREFTFRLRFTDPNASLAAPARMGQEALCPVVVHTPAGSGLPGLPPGCPFVEIDSPTAVLSAVHPDPTSDGVTIRFFETAGTAQTVNVHVRGAGRLERVDLLGRPESAEASECEQITVQVRPFEIVTLRALCRASG
jgi:hypothetical protein